MKMLISYLTFDSWQAHKLFKSYSVLIRHVDICKKGCWLKSLANTINVNFNYPNRI